MHLKNFSIFQIRYETANQKLHVTVVQCQNLPKKDILGASDPFVRVFLMPGTHAELKTKVVKKELNPTYNDEFSFVVSRQILLMSFVYNSCGSFLQQMFRKRPLYSKFLTGKGSLQMMGLVK